VVKIKHVATRNFLVLEVGGRHQTVWHLAGTNQLYCLPLCPCCQSSHSCNVIHLKTTLVHPPIFLADLYNGPHYALISALPPGVTDRVIPWIQVQNTPGWT